MYFTKRRKRLVVALSLLILLVVLAAALLIFWFTSPFPTLMRIRTAIEEEDSVTFYACLDEEYRETVRKVQMITGASLSRLLQYATNTTNSAPEDKISYRLRGYSRRGDAASIFFSTSRADGTETEGAVHFIRRDGQWYVTSKDAAESS